MIWPSSTTTFDSIERLFVDGPAFDVPGATCSDRLDASWKIVMRMVPFSPICGRMRSVMPTSLRSIVWNGLVVATPVLVNWPVTNGTLLPTTIFASSLSSVTRFGVDAMLVLAWLCSNLAIAASAKVPKKLWTRPMLRPSPSSPATFVAPPAPLPAPGVVVPVPVPAPSCAAVMASRLPVVPKFVPPTSALFWLLLARIPCHWKPKSAALSPVTSTIRLSM
jgi:hypothetical protein